jgi:two-component system, sensor histidine kinase
MPSAFIVEDDRDLAYVFQLYLLSLGWTATIILNGTDAYDRLRAAYFENRMPTAVVLDLHLPGRSGEEIFDMLRSHDLVSRTLICSADVKLVQKYIGLEATALEKPIELKELGQILNGFAVASYKIG